ncbi:MAG: class I SAM-dependent methyltransferase [Nitrospinae bacterium]|nr:class I SAM-dependent methyltransferase [Nitrospinota bacterium]
MGFYEDQILPRGIDWGMSGERFSRLRKQYLEGVGGTVLEVGFGSGLNLPHYSNRISHLYALDPSQLGRRLAAHRIQRVPFPVEFVELEDPRIALPDRSVDAVVSTWTVCTISDPVFALKEIRRVLKPEGKYYFLEHGLSPDRRVARLQNLWNPIQKWAFGGCHVNREIDRLILNSGFKMLDFKNFYMEGPKVLTYMYGGTASPQ